MRFLLSIALVITATVLLCHGFFYDEESNRALKNIPPGSEPGLRTIESNWPYTQAAVDARAAQLELWLAKKKEPEPGGAPFFEMAWEKVRRGFSAEAPFVEPPAAGAIGILGLLLAVFLPGTRFRGLALLSLLAGAAAIMPSYMSPGHQTELVTGFDFTRHVISQAPRICAGVVLLAGLTLGMRRGANSA